MKKRQTQKKPGSFRWASLLWISALILAVLIYGVARYLALASEGGLSVFQKEALYSVLWEIVPALAVLLCAQITCFVLLAKKIKTPAKELAAEIGMLTENAKNGKQKAVGDAGKELEPIRHALNGLSEDLAKLLQETKKAASEETDAAVRMEIAREIYMRAVPEKTDFGSLSFGVSARVSPAKSLGADFCDVFPLDRHRICIAIGDIWGKGVPAALFANTLKGALRERLFTAKSLQEAVSGVNDVLVHDNPFTLAATLFVGIFNPVSGELRYVNAGHLPPVVVGESLGFLQMKTGSPLGIYGDVRLTEEYIVLCPGQGLLLYTDGLTEARNKQGNFYDYDRLTKKTRELFESSLGSEHIADGLISSVKEFLGEQTDDMAVVALYYPDGIQKELRPQIAELETMRDLLFEWLKDDPRKKKIYLACEEIFTNIVHHSGARSIQFNCRKEGNSIVLRFTDDGEPFNPLPVRSEGKDFYDYGEGGMGMAIIRQIAGEIFYRTKGEYNILTVRFPAAIKEE